MRKLYHYPICPLSRQVRVLLKELDAQFTMVKEDYWQRNQEFLSLNQAGTLPVLQEASNLIIAGIYPITEYFHEKYPNFNFMDEDFDIRCEIRRLLSWFNEKFYREVTKIIIDEKIVRPSCQLGGPRTDFLRAAKTNLSHHLNYMSNLLELRSFIASNSLSCADIAAACHISVLDYFGEVNWDKWSSIRHWYAIVKSRPSFRSLLQDKIPGFTPPTCYADLDF
ncbi:MAG TPA: glutathione S-transferase family protein [Rickettsia endosymbiont of Sericostoma sp.]|uniref:glutathione S-transferase family protein n=1 Tax=unclassified Candidatus Tisiphia TaxID=2996318 RepID=UPI001D2960B0|nr:glutathione S-transferase family protein [Rickettsia endosymbiont of Sericostoma sp. HW-2014]HJD63606.1 glutathione S-transferase family protein [Rickettsia endosymbiont of Sericostoma sp.]